MGRQGWKDEAQASRPAFHRQATLSSGVERWKRAGFREHSIFFWTYSRPHSVSYI